MPNKDRIQIYKFKYRCEEGGMSFPQRGKYLSRILMDFKSQYSFEEAGILVKHDFKAGKARYEINDDHNHLIDINSGEILEFVDKDIEELQKKIAKKLGYNLVDHKLELYGSKIKK